MPEPYNNIHTYLPLSVTAMAPRLAGKGVGPDFQQESCVRPASDDGTDNEQRREDQEKWVEAGAKSDETTNPNH